MGITSGIHRSVQIRGERTATRCAGRRASWRQIATRVATLAGAFRALGLGSGDRVAVLMNNSDRYLECYAAVPWAGCVIVPLNTRWSERELLDAVDDCTPRVLIVDDTFATLGLRLAEAARVRPVAIFAGDGTCPPATSYEALLGDHSPIEDADRGGDDPAGIFYTGGTTGRSKGVVLTHANLVSNALAMLAEGNFGEDVTFLHAAPMFHMADGIACYSLLLSGGCSVMAGPFDPAATLRTIAEERISQTLLVPTMIQMLVDHPAFEQFDLGPLRRVLYGASPINEAVLDRALARLPHVELVQAYGMTELSPVATVLHAVHLTGEGRTRGRHRSAGRALLGVNIGIVGASGEFLPPGARGEVVVRGPGVMAGYWNRPDETRSALRAGWMHTGDGGYLDADGFLYIVDRIKDMIVSGGENVYSTEVENVLAQHPAVAQVAVIGIPSGSWGEQVHAVVALRAGANLTGVDLIAFAKRFLAGYKCPRSVEFRDSLPLTGAGKVTKTALRERYWGESARNVN